MKETPRMKSAEALLKECEGFRAEIAQKFAQTNDLPDSTQIGEDKKVTGSDEAGGTETTPLDNVTNTSTTPEAQKLPDEVVESGTKTETPPQEPSITGDIKSASMAQDLLATLNSGMDKIASVLNAPRKTASAPASNQIVLTQEQYQKLASESYGKGVQDYYNRLANVCGYLKQAQDAGDVEAQAAAEAELAQMLPEEALSSELTEVGEGAEMGLPEGIDEADVIADDTLGATPEGQEEIIATLVEQGLISPEEADEAMDALAELDAANPEAALADVGATPEEINGVLEEGLQDGTYIPEELEAPEEDGDGEGGDSSEDLEKEASARQFVRAVYAY